MVVFDFCSENIHKTQTFEDGQMFVYFIFFVFFSLNKCIWKIFLTCLCVFLRLFSFYFLLFTTFIHKYVYLSMFFPWIRVSMFCCSIVLYNKIFSTLINELKILQIPNEWRNGKKKRNTIFKRNRNFFLFAILLWHFVWETSENKTYI